MNEFEWILRIVDEQGIIAALLILQMLQSHRDRKALMSKNCELTRYIMHVLDHKIDEDLVKNGIAPELAKSSQTQDYYD